MNGCMNTLTLQKMRYLVTIAEQGSFTRAAGVLFVSQPSLTKSIREIEEELGFPVFERTRKGVRVTRQGEEFLAYVRQILDQADLLQEKYMTQGPRKKQYCISAHHYSFAVRAFIELVRSHQDDEFDFSFRETQTSEIVDDVAGMRSALGVMCLNNFNEPVLRRIFKERELLFEEITQVQPHVLVGVHHPLAGRRSLALDELAEYPHVSFEQGEHNSFYYAEELFNPSGHPRSIRVRDRATLFDLLLGVDAYTISNGALHPALTGTRIASIPLAGQSGVHIVIIHHRNRLLGKLSRFYIEQLKKSLQV